MIELLAVVNFLVAKGRCKRLCIDFQRSIVSPKLRLLA
jgi:hypothetical protein